MARWTQTWTCGACGHVLRRVVRYAKYGAGPDADTPLAELATRGRCTKCGVRGQCTVDEREQSRIPWQRAFQRDHGDTP